jgi:hypothetical protein
MNDMYSEAGLLQGRARAPINVLDEVRKTNLISMSFEIYKLRADIIEFTDE